jgi:hypothetical protein
MSEICPSDESLSADTPETSRGHLLTAFASGAVAATIIAAGLHIATAEPKPLEHVRCVWVVSQ